MAKKGTPKQLNLHSAAKPEVSAIELAHLTASLVTAKLIPTLEEDEDAAEQKNKWNHRRLIVAAAEFLETCEDIQAVRREAKEWEKRRESISLKLQQVMFKYESKDIIPISDIVKIAEVERIELTKAELASLGISTPWSSLDKVERARAIYLTLSEIASHYGASTPSAAWGRTSSYSQHPFIWK